ncbi:MAG: 2-deoxy-5-keto-D-gluconate 6-phosphate aldolase domain-containing protein, partial [Actinomycetota bacterium]
LQQAIADGADRDHAGALVDEEFGASVARAAKEQGFPLAMPVEKSGQEEFDFEFGEEFAAHIESFDPTFSKVLVRANPDGDKEMNDRQFARLRRLSGWLHDHDRRFLFELLVPATPEQLDEVEGSAARYDTEVRPKLMLRTIEQIQDAGIEPDVWKIEGIDSTAECAEIAALVKRDGRDGVGCVVLGRGADDAAVEAWLRAGAVVPGYQGFAIGRSIFNESVKGLATGTMERSEAVRLISQKYRHFVDVYEARA